MRVIVYDADRYDRGLLSLALRSALPELTVAKAGSLLELMHELSSGPVAAVVGDPGTTLAEVSDAIRFARQREPACLFWLFTAEEDAPTAESCVGLGVDGRDRKDSAGYLSLPQRLLERVRQTRELGERYPEEAATLMGSAVPAASALVDGEGRFRAVNQELEVLFKLPRYAMLDTGLAQMGAANERVALQQILNGPRQRNSLTLSVAHEGSASDEFSLLLRPLGEQPRQGSWWILSASTALRAAELPGSPALTARNAELEQLLFAVTHDLQAPLNSLASNARWLVARRSELGQELAESSQEIAALTQRMQQMLDGILAVSTVRSGQSEPEAVNLDNALTDALANLQSEIDEVRATIERYPLPTLLVNRQQMVQVFQNLLSNALKFRGPRPPRVRISSQDSGDCLRIVVQDNGIGIAPRDIPRIFGMFQRLHSEQEYPGLGIGLAICRQIVRAHGGELFVDSSPGNGSIFMMEFRGPGLRSVIRPVPREVASR